MRHRRLGQPLCTREPLFCLAFVGFKSDLAYDKMTFKFNTYDQRLCCMHCKAVKSGPGPLYTEIGTASAWRAEPRTTQSYLLEHNSDLEVLTQIPGWCLALHRGDPMHLIFLGFGLHVLGSAIVDLARRGSWGNGNLRTKLMKAWQLGLFCVRLGSLVVCFCVWFAQVVLRVWLVRYVSCFSAVLD